MLPVAVDDSSSLVAWIDEFKLTVEERLEALNSALDSLGAPPAEHQQIVSVHPARETSV